MINLHSSTHHIAPPVRRPVAGAEPVSGVAHGRTAEATAASRAHDPARRVPPNSAVPAQSVSGRRPTNAPERGAESADAQLVKALASRDREVRTHEQAHLAAAGGLANGGAHYSFTRGPDGRQYAVGGEVSIDIAPVANDPQATIDKAQKIRRAALAPSNPSAADRGVAARATAMANEARLELQREARELENSAEAEDVADERADQAEEAGLAEAYRNAAEPSGGLVNTAA